MPDAPPKDLGSTSTEEVREAGIAAYGLQPDVTLSPMEQLCDKVLGITRARLSDPSKAAVETASGGFAVFLLTRSLREDRERLKASRAPNLDAGAERLAGRLWIVPPTLASAGCLDFSASNMGEAFEEIEGFQLGSYAAVVVDFTNLEMRIYQDGVVNDEVVFKAKIDQLDLTEVSLDKILYEFNETNVATPNCQCTQIKVWNDSTNYIPAPLTEKKIQDLLFLFLQAKLSPTHRVEYEKSLRSGRIDLIVNRRIKPGVWEAYAAIELKVARSFSNTGKPKSPGFLTKHMARGYKQIKAYKAELEARQGWLVLYDMRKLDQRTSDPFDPHRADAASDAIDLHMDLVFGTADDWRDHWAA